MDPGIFFDSFRRRASVVACLLLAVVCCSGLSAQETAPVEALPEAEPLPSVIEMIAARQRLQDFLFSLGEIDTADALAGPQNRLAELQERLQPISDAVASSELGNLDLDALLDLETEVRTEIRDLETLAQTLSTRAGLRDTQLDALAEHRAQWAVLTDAAEQRNAPPDILAIAASAAGSLDDAQRTVLADRDATLQVLNRVADLGLDANAFAREIRGRRQGLETATQRAAGLPLWNIELELTRALFVDAWSAVEGYLGSLRDYLVERGIALLLMFLVVGAATRWLLKVSGEKARAFVESSERHPRMLAVFEEPNSAALLVALLGVLWFASDAPVAYNNVLLALLPFPAAAVASTVFAKPLRLSIYVLAAALCLLAVTPFYQALPLTTRLALYVQTLAVAAAFYLDWKRGNWTRAFPDVSPNRLKHGVRAICVVLVSLPVIDALGFVGMATTLRTLILGGLGYGLIFTALAHVLTGLVLAGLQARVLSGFAIVAQRPWEIVRFSGKLIRGLAFIAWITSTMALSALASRAVDGIVGVLSTEISIGAVNVRLAAVIAGILVVWLAMSLNRFIRFVMESRLLKDERAAAGLSFAISKVLGYCVIVAGFLLALAAMGFDLTRVTVLAGALGVGIGLGLQNIANNFVSGIILLFERPINVNDIAKVDETIGTVKEIGIRSTVLQTFDGAEVIVPNADFIAKTVLNWTKSNRRRRAEIDIGVAYGTEPAKVLEILETAANSHDDVMQDPVPLATFTGFGDSSLNFRLYVWLSDVSNILSTPSLLRRQILEALNGAGIEIPFPQRDIRVTMSATAQEPGRGVAEETIAEHGGAASQRAARAFDSGS